MKPALGYKWIAPLDNWQAIPNGEWLLEKENALLAEHLAYCFGDHLLKVGRLSNQLDCSASLIKHQVNLAPKALGTDGVGVFGELDELPFLPQSLDSVVMTHVLEFCADPHQVLREAHRVLMPNGNLLLTLFNPISMLAMSKLWPIKSHKPFWRARLFTVGRIKDWLSLLGFEVVDENYTCYSSLLTKQVAQDTRFARTLRHFAPKMGSVCIINAKKREWPLTPIRPRLRYKTVFNPAVRSASASKIKGTD